MKQLIKYPIQKKKMFLLPLYFLIFMFSIVSVSAFTYVLQDQPETLTDSDSSTTKQGMSFTLNQTMVLYNVTFGSLTNADTAYLYDGVGHAGTLLKSVGISSNTAIFNYSLNGNQNYTIVVDSGGSSFTRTYVVTGGYPDAQTYLTWTTGTSGATHARYSIDYVYIYENVSSPTPTINSNLSTYYNVSNISVQLNTTSNVNMSYILNNGSETSICNDCNNSLVNLTLIDGLNNISWLAVDSNGDTNNTEQTTLDTTLPVINNNILTEYNLYTINGFNSSCTENNLDYCNISINSQNVLLNTSSFTFTGNGNISYNITAKDLAGNLVTETGTTLINPYQYFRMYDSARAFYVQNYTFGGVSSIDDYVSIPLYDLGVGTHNLSFVKSSYSSEYFDFELNLSSSLNQTFNVTPNSLYFTLKDFSTFNNISNWQLIIKQNSTILHTENVTSDYTLYYNESYIGDLEFIFQKTDYNPSYYFISYTSNSIVTETIYLLNSSATTLMPITVKDIFGINYISNASVNLYGLNGYEEYFIDEQITDNAGKVYFTLHDDFNYKLIISKNGYVTTNYKISPSESSYTFLIPEESTNLNYIFQDFSVSIDLYNVSNVTYLRARYTDEDSLISLVTLNLTSDTKNATNNSLVSSSDTILISLPTNESYLYNAHLQVLRDGETYNFYEIFTNTQYLSNNSVSLGATEYLDTDEDKYLITLIVVFGSLLLGYLFFGMPGALLLGFISILSLWYLTILSVYLAMPLLLLILLMFGFFRGGDY